MDDPHPTRLRPLLVYDGDCGFCAASVRFVEHRARPNCTVVAWQFTNLDALGATERRARREVLWVTPTGTVYGGSSALAKALLSGGGRWWHILGGLLLTAPVRPFARGVYRLVAANRHKLPDGTTACRVGAGPPSPQR
ncbi:thiol-disulfide oxidoreductase DCC family protein [Streptomyces sp. NPDC058045]|uniref:thiol-disulfide oxidoreductase DCC family protein n=1 Tax=Streptomyces sp. NPDC058045 TaxID=3346311 RepID=UPI0036ED8C71